jgi:hypothetical protein
VAFASAGAGITIMLSGYASGGQIGLPLAAALTGAVGVSLVSRQPSYGEGALSVGIVSLFALLIMGRFFGELATNQAFLLFLGLLLGWLPELPYVRRLGPRLRGFARVVLIMVPVVVALMLAQQKFVKDSAGTSQEDYMDLGK